MAAGELEEQPGVDRADRGARRPVHVAPQPLDLGRREVGVEDEPGALAHQRLVPGGAQLGAALRRAPVLPDERPVQRLARRPVPGENGLALVGDADAVQVGALDAGIGDRLHRDPPRHLPDLGRVVLDPARPREVLLELRVGPPDDPALCVEDQAGRAGRPLVDREDHRWDPRTIVSRPSATPAASSPPVPSRRSPIPYIRATIERACRAGSGTSSISSAARATSS